MISPGQRWEDEINQRLESAKLILLLVSAYFLDSDYCYEKEMKRALERHKDGEAQVIPIILRPVDWEIAPFKELQCLPKDGLSVEEWPNVHAAFRDVAQGIRRAAETEIQRQAEKEERQHRAAEAEVRRKAEGAEAQRRAQEEARRQAEEAEARRQTEETEAQRRAAEAEAQRRQAQEAEEKQRATDTEAGGKAKVATPDRKPSNKVKIAITGALVIVFLAVGGYLMTDQDRKPPPISVQPSADNDGQIQKSSPPPVAPPTATGPAIQNIHGWPADKVQALQQQAAKALGTPVVFQDTLKDGSQGPEMVVIPGGRFVMGSPPDESQRESDESQHEVEVKSFAIGKYEVTFEQYDRFAKATGRQQPDDQGWGRGQRPVINVSWQDAVAYANWLSQQTGQAYRLPTEVEWEYAVRAGTVTPFYFGSTISTDQANYDGDYTYGAGRKGVDRGKTVEVGRFPANAWGLYDMHGNVWEWTCSEYDKGYAGADRCVSDSGSGGPRVLRGGSWGGKPGRLRAASRTWGGPDYRDYDLGFRLARSF